MDSSFFRLPTQPNQYKGIPQASPGVNAVDPKKKWDMLPAPDSRYPGWAAPMSDGRLVTDQSSPCETNVAPANQFATKAWMQKNASQIIQVSRERQAIHTGAYLGFDTSVVPPAEAIVRCDPADCSRRPTEIPGGIGTNRMEGVPDLFGTYSIMTQGAPPPSRTQLTRVQEGGRNTPRGMPDAGSIASLELR